MSDVKAPAPNPCGSCPYRRDVPPGVWAEEEYAKLPGFDGETWEQTPAIFLCHQQDGRLCAGWVACHDMAESFGLRMAVGTGTISPEVADSLLDYATTVPLFETGAEAAAHGLSEIEEPGAKARRTIDKLVQRGKVRG